MTVFDHHPCHHPPLFLTAGRCTCGPPGTDRRGQAPPQAGHAINEPLINGLTALHLAASFNHVETVAFLLASGANPRETQRQGQTPLHLAAYNGHIQVMRLLIAKGSPLGLPDKATKATPLHYAAGQGQLAAVQLLVASGAPVNPVNSIGMSPLDSALETDQHAVAAWLRQNGGVQLLQ